MFFYTHSFYTHKNYTQHFYTHKDYTHKKYTQLLGQKGISPLAKGDFTFSGQKTGLNTVTAAFEGIF